MDMEILAQPIWMSAAQPRKLYEGLNVSFSMFVRIGIVMLSKHRGLCGAQGMPTGLDNDPEGKQ